MVESGKELKTLKDLEDGCSEHFSPFGYCPPHVAEWIRDIAREYLKDLETQPNRFVSLYQFIRYFFNLEDK